MTQIDQSTISEGFEYIWQAAIAMSAICFLASLFFHKKNSLESLRKQMKMQSTELPRNVNMSAQQFEDFNKLDDLSKKKKILEGSIFSNNIISWSLAESISILGLLVTLSGNSPNYENFYYFIATSVLLMIYLFPRDQKKLDQIRY